MNKDTAKNYLPLVRALAEGKVIQCRMTEYMDWYETTNPDFSMSPDSYRIKPDPKEIWVNEYPFHPAMIHPTESSARNCAMADAITRRYREVIE